ncbi:metal-dependent hydrolase [Vibrio campbellii]|uniref:metal-dependent hydrolase n=1 Tax=Vibrio campbellii TaxID=680 RepID=UPI0021093A4D|nr:metal-dependent hydrolase [Vibrio campbellii]UTZ44548.1 hypothetical protein HB764_25135 [Vibrio campbellii]
MNRIGHTYGAMMFAPLPAAILLDASPLHSMLGALACISAANLPDRLEFGRIPHRTFTHTLSIWLVMAAYGYMVALSLTNVPIAALQSTSTILGAIICGFGCGGISHWLGDVLNKQPVSTFTPWDGFALYLFKSGEHQRFTVALIGLEAWFIILFLRAM